MNVSLCLDVCHICYIHTRVRRINYVVCAFGGGRRRHRLYYDTQTTESCINMYGAHKAYAANI